MTEDPPPTPQGRGGSVSRRDHNQLTGTRAHFQAEPSMQKQPTQTPAALRERGSGGEALLSEKRPLPQSPPEYLFPYLFVHVYDAEALLDETLGGGEDVG